MPCFNFDRASCNNRFHRHLPDRICRQRKCPVPYCFHPLFSCRFNCCLHYNIFISSGQQQSPYISVTGVSQSDLLWGWKCAKELQISVWLSVQISTTGSRQPLSMRGAWCSAQRIQIRMIAGGNPTLIHATWQSPGTIHRFTEQYWTLYREWCSAQRIKNQNDCRWQSYLDFLPRRHKPPRNDTVV